MRRLVWIGLALAAAGVLVRTEEEEDGGALLATPVLMGLAIECAVFLLRNSQGRLLNRQSW